jgi:hypothetical protein
MQALVQESSILASGVRRLEGFFGSDHSPIFLKLRQPEAEASATPCAMPSSSIPTPCAAEKEDASAEKAEASAEKAEASATPCAMPSSIPTADNAGKEGQAAGEPVGNKEMYECIDLTLEDGQESDFGKQGRVEADPKAGLTHAGSRTRGGGQVGGGKGIRRQNACILSRETLPGVDHDEHNHQFVVKLSALLPSTTTNGSSCAKEDQAWLNYVMRKGGKGEKVFSFLGARVASGLFLILNGGGCKSSHHTPHTTHHTPHTTHHTHTHKLSQGDGDASYLDTGVSARPWHS